MRTNFHPRNRQQKSPLRQILLILLFFIIIGGLMYLLRNPISGLARPVWRAKEEGQSALSYIGQSLRSKKVLVKENEELKEKLILLEADSRALRLLQDREKELLRLLGRTAENGGVIASLIAYPPSTPYDVVIVDAGNKENLSVGQEVYTLEGALLGRIAEVFARTSKVKLFSTSGQKTNAVLERGNQPIIIEGRGAGNFKTTLPREIAVEVGDRIFFPYLSLPLLAQVSEISIRPTDSFKEILAKGPTNIFTMRYVKVRTR